MVDELTKRVLKIKQYYKLSQAEFADMIDIQRSSISHMVNGRNKASADMVIRILQAYPEIRAEWIMRGEGEMIKSDKEEDLFDTPTETETEIKKDKFSKEKNKIDEPTLKFKDKFEGKKEEQLIKDNKEDEAQHTDNNKNIVSPFNTNAQGKEIVRIIIFYSDKTFVDFKPE